MQPTVFTLKGHTDSRQVVTIKGFGYQFMLDKGTINLNFPWLEHEKIADIIDYQAVEERVIVVDNS